METFDSIIFCFSFKMKVFVKWPFGFWMWLQIDAVYSAGGCPPITWYQAASNGQCQTLCFCCWSEYPHRILWTQDSDHDCVKLMICDPRLGTRGEVFVDTSKMRLWLEYWARCQQWTPCPLDVVLNLMPQEAWTCLWPSDDWCGWEQWYLERPRSSSDAWCG